MLYKLFTITAALAALCIAAPAVDPNAADGKVKGITRAYLTNCYTNPTDGTRGEIDFFYKTPTFGNSKGDFISVVSDGVNEVWESGGSTSVGKATFSWTINYTYETVQSVPPGAEVGSAKLSTGQVFTLIKGPGETLYKEGSNPEYDCGPIYTAVQTNGK